MQNTVPLNTRSRESTVETEVEGQQRKLRRPLKGRMQSQQQQQQQCSGVYELMGGVCKVARHPLHKESVEEGCG